jgi:hypothetical protein
MLIAAALIVGLAACSPEIGDSCVTGQECGTGAFCDTTAPQGYCTISPCEAGLCPDESVCIEFDGEVTACMLRCNAPEDCRSGYACRDDKGPVNFCYIAAPPP